MYVLKPSPRKKVGTQPCFPQPYHGKQDFSTLGESPSHRTVMRARQDDAASKKCRRLGLALALGGGLTLTRARQLHGDRHAVCINRGAPHWRGCGRAATASLVGLRRGRRPERWRAAGAFGRERSLTGLKTCAVLRG